MRIILFLVVALYCITSFAEESISILDNSDVTCEEMLQAGSSEEEIMKRGCCSHHGGVCGCDGTKLRCCDGSNSPSCKCYKSDDPITTPKTDIMDV